MPNGMPSWEEWDKQLSEEQRRYSLFKVLTNLYVRDTEREKAFHDQIAICNIEFKKLKARKWFDRGAALVGGLISGIIGALGLKMGS